MSYVAFSPGVRQSHRLINSLPKGWIAGYDQLASGSGSTNQRTPRDVGESQRESSQKEVSDDAGQAARTPQGQSEAQVADREPDQQQKVSRVPQAIVQRRIRLDLVRRICRRVRDAPAVERKERKRGMRHQRPHAQIDMWCRALEGLQQRRQGDGGDGVGRADDEPAGGSGGIELECASDHDTRPRQTPDGALGLLILLDQFPRNAFRGTPRMYSTDELARRTADAAIASGFDCLLAKDLSLFMYLPFGHSENLADQERSVAFAQRLGQPGIAHAERHRDIIRRFGRFPHRNPILGRAMRPEEQAYLDNGGFQG